MSQLKIVDLNFCEAALDDSEVQGGLGISVSSPTGKSSWSVSADSAHSAGYFTTFFFDKSSGDFGFIVAGGVAGAVAGAAAGALADGSTYANAFSVSGTF